MTNARMARLSQSAFKTLGELDQDVLVDLWDVDLRTLGGNLEHYCNVVNTKEEAIIWKGTAYQPYPIHGEGFELSGQGPANRPKITVSNLFGLITGLADQYNQLVGATVVRRQTLTRFLDAANFTDGNATADPTQEVVTKYLIERMASLTTETATFELAVPSESDGATIPSRLMLANICCWQYRGEGCGYTGKPVADRFDMPTDDPLKDDCSKGLLGCRARYGATAVLPIGAFPSADKVLS